MSSVKGLLHACPSFLTMKKPAEQRGAATLIVALVLLIALTLVTFSTARIGVSEQRNSTNNVRSKAALDVAQAGLEQGLAYLNHNQSMIDSTGVGGWATPGGATLWLACPVAGSPPSKMPPCGDGIQNYNPGGPAPGSWLYYSPLGGNIEQIPNSGYDASITYLTPSDVTGTPRDDPTIVIVSQATPTTDALAGDAIATLIVRRYSVLRNIPRATIIANSSVDLTGGVNIWGNRSAVASPPALGPYNPVVTTTTASTPPAQDGVSYDPTPSAATADPPSGPLAASTIVTLATTTTTRDGLTTTTNLTGTPLSIWIRDLSVPPNWIVDTSELTISGAPTATCRNFPYDPLVNDSCSGGTGDFTISRVGNIQADIVAGYVVSRREPGTVYCAPFPGTSLPLPYPPPCTNTEAEWADLFAYVFGVTDAQSSLIKNSPETTLLANCDDLDNLPPGRYWVTGSCTINSGVTVGSSETPYLLVVDNTDFTLNGGATFYGLIYSRETLPGAADITLAGGATLLGSLVSDHDITDVSGGFKAVYDASVLMRLSRTAGGFTKLSGGWLDGTQ